MVSLILLISYINLDACCIKLNVSQVPAIAIYGWFAIKKIKYKKIKNLKSFAVCVCICICELNCVYFIYFSEWPY